MHHYRPIQRGISAIFVALFTLAIAIAIASSYFIFSQSEQQKNKKINSFEDCAKHYPVMESYPEQCKTPDGKHFTRHLSESEKQRAVNPEELLQNSNKTPAWNTFNHEFGYSIKYPSHYKIEELGIPVGAENALEIAIFLPPNQNSENPKIQAEMLGKSRGKGMNIYVVSKDDAVFKSLALKEIVERNIAAGKKNKNSYYQVLEDIKETPLDGEKAYTYTVDTQGYSGEWDGVYHEDRTKLRIFEFEHNGYHFRIYYNLEDLLLEEAMKSFKFLK